MEEKEEEVVLANVSSGCLGRRRKRIWMGGIRRTLRLSQAAGDGWRKSTWLCKLLAQVLGRAGGRRDKFKNLKLAVLARDICELLLFFCVALSDAFQSL